MGKGKLIVIEGSCDGVGKTTQIALLKEKMHQDKIETISHHFPSFNTYHGSPVEHYLKGELGTANEVSPYLVNALYGIDRAIAWKTILEQEYINGKTILLDRYTTSSQIYQAAALETVDEKIKFVDYVEKFEYEYLGVKRPDKLIYLHAPFDIVEKLRNERKTNEGIEKDVFERDIEYLKRVYETSLLVSEYLKWETIECIDQNTNIPSMRSIEDIHEEVYELVRKIK